jgi:hypothetical protein
MIGVFAPSAPETLRGYRRSAAVHGQGGVRARQRRLAVIGAVPPVAVVVGSAATPAASALA